MRISVPRHSSGRDQRAELPHPGQPKRRIGRTRGRSHLWGHVVEIEERRGITLAFPCGAHLALSAPDVPLCLLKWGTSGVVVPVSGMVYPTTFLPKFPAFFPVEMGVRFFLGLPTRPGGVADCRAGAPAPLCLMVLVWWLA